VVRGDWLPNKIDIDILIISDRVSSSAHWQSQMRSRILSKLWTICLHPFRFILLPEKFTKDGIQSSSRMIFSKWTDAQTQCMVTWLLNLRSKIIKPLATLKLLKGEKPVSDYTDKLISAQASRLKDRQQLWKKIRWHSERDGSFWN